MAIARVKTWSAGEVLTASDLNSEFNNLLNNPVDLWSPAGKAADFNGFEVILDGDADTSITADTDDRLDFRLGGVDLFVMNGTTASCVNGITLFGTATGTNAYIRANGSDSNTAIDLRDANGNELLKTAAVASAVNEVTFTNAATGNPARVHATGETNVGLQLEPKGSGKIRLTDGTDTTKVLSIDASGLTTATVRTLTLGDADFTLRAATQAEVEAASSNVVVATPGRINYNPGVAKGWCKANINGTAAGSHNVTSVTDNGAGDATVTWATDFGDANYAAVVSAVFDPAGSTATTLVAQAFSTSYAAGTTRVGIQRVSDGAGSDPSFINIAAFGDQA